MFERMKEKGAKVDQLDTKVILPNEFEGKIQTGFEVALGAALFGRTQDYFFVNQKPLLQ